MCVCVHMHMQKAGSPSQSKTIHSLDALKSNTDISKQKPYKERGWIVGIFLNIWAKRFQNQ